MGRAAHPQDGESFALAAGIKRGVPAVVAYPAIDRADDVPDNLTVLGIVRNVVVSLSNLLDVCVWNEFAPALSERRGAKKSCSPSMSHTGMLSLESPLLSASVCSLIALHRFATAGAVSNFNGSCSSASR